MAVTGRLSAHAHSFRAAARTGWLLESNWLEPWLFLLYVVVKPLTGSLLLVCMFYAVQGAAGASGRARVAPEFLPYMVVGNACFALVGAVMFGMSHALLSDREHYRMLKYVYISPGRLATYAAGRGLSGGLQALLGGLVNITVAALAFSEVRAAFARHPVEWGYLLLYLLLGVALLTALGVLLAGAILNMSRQGGFLSEGVAGMMYLACGVVFPLSILPGWLRGFGLALPPTYWIEGVRRSLLGTPPEEAALLQSPLTAWTHGELLAALAGTTAVLAVVAGWVFRVSERRAWRDGRLEEQSGA